MPIPRSEILEKLKMPRSKKVNPLSAGAPVRVFRPSAKKPAALT